MSTPFDKVPLNTKSSYISAVAIGGCRVYVPVDTRDAGEMKVFQTRFQSWFDHNQFGPQEPDAA